MLLVSDIKVFQLSFGFSVNVPVLSDAMMSVAPNVSTAGNLRITAFRLAMTCVPGAKMIVTIAGNPSGIAATARERLMSATCRPKKYY